MTRLRGAFTLLGYLAVWNALYAAALVVAFTQLLGLDHDPIALVGAFFLSLSVFLLDRVKPSDALLDPADQDAHPERFAFHRAHARWLRALILVGVLTGAGCMVLAHRPVAAVLAILAPVGVLLYGTLRPPTGVRIKDRPLRKNLTVALALACFAALITLGPTFRVHPSVILDRAPAELCAFVWVILVVAADAAICDLDDAVADATHNTRTLANTLPRKRLWLLATLAHVVAAPLACWSAALSGANCAPVVAWWAVVPGVSLLLIALWRPPRVRDAVDARFAAIAAVAVVFEFTLC